MICGIQQIHQDYFHSGIEEILNPRFPCTGKEENNGRKKEKI